MKKINIKQLAQTTDDAIDNKNYTKLNECKNKILSCIKSNDASEEEKSRLHYFLANIFLCKYQNKSKIDHNKLSEKKDAINNFYLAIGKTQNKIYLLQYYINLGNILAAECRYLEAFELYQKAYLLDPKWIMVNINRMSVWYEILKEDLTQRQSHLYITKTLLEESKKYNCDEFDYREYPSKEKGIGDLKFYQNKFSTLESYFVTKDKVKAKLSNKYLAWCKAKLSNKYLAWCNGNLYLLNYLNLINTLDSFEDNVMPSISIKEGDFILTMWQQLSQEYCSARYSFFLYKDFDFPKKGKHISDRCNSISKTGSFKLEYVLKNKEESQEVISSSIYRDSNHCLSYEIEELKSSYTKLYGILNKITVLLFSYIKLIKNCEVEYLKTIQENAEIKDDRIELHAFDRISKDIENIKKNNPFLYSLISIYDDVCGSNGCDEFKKIKKIRDKIAHGYIKISYYDGRDFFDYSYIKTIQANYLKISLHEFKANFEKLLVIVRNSFFYVDLCINNIEQKKSKSS